MTENLIEIMQLNNYLTQLRRSRNIETENLITAKAMLFYQQKKIKLYKESLDLINVQIILTQKKLA